MISYCNVDVDLFFDVLNSRHPKDKIPLMVKWKYQRHIVLYMSAMVMCWSQIKGEAGGPAPCISAQL